MKLNELSPAPGSSRKRFRVGRGTGSGNGKTAGRGSKGQNSRSGGGVRPGFEGGQMPLQRRLPKRGFRNIFAKTLVGINVDMLERFPDGSTINAQALRDAGIVKNVRDGVKILGRGELTRKLTVEAAAFSGTARGKIEAAGGKAEVV